MTTVTSLPTMLAKLNFVDLYIGEDYCDIKGLDGAKDTLSPASLGLLNDVGVFRDRCQETYEAQGEPEFSVMIDGILFRGTALTDVLNKTIFTLRRSTAEIRPLDSIGLSPAVTRLVLDPRMRGLILVAGEMGVGKTSTLASMFRARVMEHGGLGIAIEDPNETVLNGQHGKGRIIQVRASRKNGGYREQLLCALRTGADEILIGEIRDEAAAFEVAQASVNGHMIFSTIHGTSIEHALERFSTKCQVMTPNANGLLADGLTAVVWQNLEKVPRQQPNTGYSKRLVSKVLMVAGDTAVMSKIRDGKFHQLAQDIEEQTRRTVWQGGK